MTRTVAISKRRSAASLHPEKRIYTFWDYFRNHWAHNAGLRIDYLLVNAALAPRLAEAGVETWVRGQQHPSDHAPAWVTLSDARRPRKRGKAAAKTAKRQSGRRRVVARSARPDTARCRTD